jgi:large subunit ribosomal protein L22
MEVRAVARYLPISAQKARLVIDTVRGMPADDALEMLYHMPQKGAPLVSKVINSAIFNATENYALERERLYVAKIYADEGPTRKWRKFGARGRFKPWLRRSAHVTVILDELEDLPDVEEEEEDEE